jgi:hypothetical protein
MRRWRKDGVMESRGRRGPGPRIGGPSRRPISSAPNLENPVPVQEPERDAAPGIEAAAADDAPAAASTPSWVAAESISSGSQAGPQTIGEPPPAPSEPPAEDVVSTVASPMPPAPPAGAPTPPPAGAPGRTPMPAAEFGGLSEMQASFAQGLAQLSEEVNAFLRRSIDNAAQTGIDLLGVRTWSDAIAANSKYAQTCFDLWVDSSARISELGIKLALESSRRLQRV